MTDQYAESAEFLDIMSRDAWRVLGPVLADALRRQVGPAEMGMYAITR